MAPFNPKVERAGGGCRPISGTRAPAMGSHRPALPSGVRVTDGDGDLHRVGEVRLSL
jgi:hypothetical protein